MTKMIDPFAQSFLSALEVCTQHLDAEEVFEVCSRGGEQELNDLLRHAVNRIVRPMDQRVQREQTRPGVSRADLMLSDLGSGSILAILEAKMRYMTDAIESPEHVRSAVRLDLKKLAGMAGTIPCLFLMWSPYFALMHRTIRWMAGHDQQGVDWKPRRPMQECVDAMTELLAVEGACPVTRVRVREASGDDGDVTLFAWLLQFS